MTRQSFNELLKKYLEGDSTPVEVDFVEYWYTLLDDETAVQDLSDDELEERLWNKIQTKYMKR